MSARRVRWRRVRWRRVRWRRVRWRRVRAAALRAPIAASLALAACDASPQAEATPSLTLIDDSTLVAVLRARLDSDAASGAFAGAVLVQRDGRTLLERAYGLADRERRVPNTPTTRFRVGSMNKMLTAVSVLQLVQAGKVKLAEPLGTYLPDYPNEDVARKVTIHHLLTHTGGTGDIFGPQFFEHRAELRTTGDYVKRYGARPLRFEPGARWEYSNYGFILLGAVIERVSGTSYEDYVATHVLAPAGMTGTVPGPDGTAVAESAVGYTVQGGAGAPVPDTATLPYAGSPAGGWYSTVGDLARFATALRAHRLLDSAHTALLLAGKVKALDARYAYGFFDREVGGWRFVGHGGGAPGMNGDLAIQMPAGYVVTALSNLDPPAAQREVAFVLDRLPTH